MKLLLALITGAWLTLILMSFNPHTTSPGAIALAEIFTLPMVIVLTVVLVMEVRR
jgi:hypothetical protein